MKQLGGRANGKVLQQLLDERPTVSPSKSGGLRRLLSPADQPEQR